MSNAERTRQCRARKDAEVKQLQARILELERRLADVDGRLMIDLPKFDRDALKSLSAKKQAEIQERARKSLIDWIRGAVRKRR